jgi:putative phosphoribosyl transferase
MAPTTLQHHPTYSDRAEAGRQLAVHLTEWSHHPLGIVLALPRGGVPVAWEIANALQLPLDVLIVRKIGHPGHPELTVAAIAAGDATVVNHSIAADIPQAADFLEPAIASAKIKLRRREGFFRGRRPPLDLEGKGVILVDDGAATGATMRAAAQAVRLLGATRCIVTLPVATAAVCRTLRSEGTQVVCPLIPESEFGDVGEYYENFAPVSDSEIRELLSRQPAESGSGFQMLPPQAGESG